MTPDVEIQYLRPYFVPLQFISGFNMDMEQVHAAMRPLLLQMGNYRNLNLNVIQTLSYLTQLFPNIFNEKFCDQILVGQKHYTKRSYAFSIQKW